MDLLKDIDSGAYSELLRIASRNAKRSVSGMCIAATYIAYLGWAHGNRLEATAVFLIGWVVAVWRYIVAVQHERRTHPTVEQLDLVARRLEANTVVSGLMWVCATLSIFPDLVGDERTIYLCLICGSVAIGAFFMGLVRRAFGILCLMHVVSVAAVSLWRPEVSSPSVSLLMAFYCWVAYRSSSDFANATREAVVQRIRADAADRAKSRFLAVISHELRTPMHAVMGSLELLKGHALPTESRQLIETAASSGTLLVSLLNDVLDVTKAQEAKIQLAHTPVSLAASIDSVVSLLRPGAGQRGLDLRVMVDAELPRGVLSDRRRLEQVLFNLLGNSIKFTDVGYVQLVVRVTRLSADQAQVYFEISDTGIGMSQDVLDRLFSPFFQSTDVLPRKVEGTGLGLFISRSIVEAMGATLKVESHEGQGSCFSFEVTFDVTTEEPVTQQATPLVTPEAKDVTVLVVDDLPVNRLLASEMLKRLGAKVIEAESGLAALETLAHTTVDLVLMDGQMPVLDGYQTTLQIRQREADRGLKRTPVIALSASAYADDVQRSLDAGMDGHLSKPYRLEELEQILKKWTQPPIGG
ncbi:ATP-binding protein [Aquabacterium sp.]|uniref:ATP-binding protein n=1 Tax=Aquabacterium sp. TaxID=1872578 RepID=UPI002E37877B|nr:ATP-binding protein [Aquabacterium sp.]HEX5311837.1 ATP-binding protein [Aquabacterium sp.]